MKSMSKVGVTAVFVVVTLILATGAWAQDVIDPATLQMNAGTSYLYLGELHSVTGNSVLVKQNQGGNQATLVNPVLLLLGIAGNSNTAPTLQTGNSYGGFTVNSGSGLASTTLWGVNFGSQTSTNPAATMNNLSGSSSAYDLTGLANTGAFGQIWSNWSAAYKSLMGTSSVPNNQFQIFTYAIYLTPNVGAKDTFQAMFTSNLPTGSFIIGFGCQGVTNIAAACPGTSTNPFTTPFTEAGFVQNGPPQVPEPASMLLFGTGLVAAAGMIRRRFKG